MAALGLWSAVALRQQGDVAVQNALILQRVQALGDLHTARFNYQDAFDYQTSVEPAKWVSYVPGGESLVESATRNRALITTVGGVEAGVDLRRATISRSGDRIVVTLPSPSLYDPTVRAWARDVHSGLFWADDNLGLKAAEVAKARMREAAIRQGILDRAASEARARVSELLGSTTDRSVEVVVPSGDGLTG